MIGPQACQISTEVLLDISSSSGPHLATVRGQAIQNGHRSCRHDKISLSVPNAPKVVSTLRFMELWSYGAMELWSRSLESDVDDHAGGRSHSENRKNRDLTEYLADRFRQRYDLKW
jgi:hypothetical protein